MLNWWTHDALRSTTALGGSFGGSANVRSGACSPAWRRAALLGSMVGLAVGIMVHSNRFGAVVIRHAASSSKMASLASLVELPSNVASMADLLSAHSSLPVPTKTPSPTRSPSPPSLRPLPAIVVGRPAIVAVCVGGWLELATPRRGQSLRDHILNVMPSDVFVAGTIRGNVTESRVDAALDGISALAPFASASVIRMPRPSELRSELKKSGHWEDFKLQASKGGSGRFNWADPSFDDPRNWVPIMMSPALGNPNGNTLQEFHYQSRCIEMINGHEASGGPRRPARTPYERVMFTRLEFEWLASHPPLHLLDQKYLWVPTGEDNTGVNDRHWLASRRDAEGVFRRWDALIEGKFHGIFFATSQVGPRSLHVDCLLIAS